MGRRTAATGSLLPQGGLSSGMHPPFLFCLAKRETGRARSKDKSVWRAPVQWPSARRGSAYRCLLRFGLAFGHAMAFCEVDTAVPWRMVRRVSGCKNAFDQLLFPRVPLRYALLWRAWGHLYGDAKGHSSVRRGRCPHRPVAPAPINHRPAAAKIGAACIPDFPGPKGSPRAVRFRL